MNATTTNSIDIKYEIYLLICKYANKNPFIRTSIITKEELDSFISYAYVYMMEHINKHYDSTKSALSTYIYACMDKLWVAFLNQTKYDCSFKSALKLTNHYTREKTRNQISALYKNTIPIDWCGTNNANYDSDENNSTGKFNYIELGTSEYNYDGCPDSYLSKEKFTLEAFNQVLNDYINFKYKDGKFSVDTEKMKNIISDYILDKLSDERHKKTTYTLVSKKYGITRQRVEQIVSGFVNYAKNNKKFRDSFNF